MMKKLLAALLIAFTPSLWAADYFNILDKSLYPTTFGTSGYCWKSNGAGVAPDWGSCLTGGGTVTSVSVTTANGVSGSVATATTTPAITLTLGAITPSSISTGAITSSALTSGRVPFATTAGLLTDASTLTFAAGTLSATTFSGAHTGTFAGNTITTGTGTLTLGSATLNAGTGGTLGSAAFTAAGAYEVPLTFSTGLTRTVNTVTVNASQSISTLSNLTGNGLVTTSGGTGALSIMTPGTGILTALGVNVGSAGAPVINGGALGTPSSGTATNLSGTAASLTAGLATDTVSKTGTGSTYATSASPTFTGTVGAASISASGTISVAGDVTSTAASGAHSFLGGTSGANGGYLSAYGNTFATNGSRGQIQFIGERSDANATAGSVLFGSTSAGGSFLYNGVFQKAGNFVLSSTIMHGWASGALDGNGAGTIDTNFNRAGPGSINLGTTAANALGSLNLTNLTASGTVKTGGSTVALLPAGTIGMRYYVTDQLTTCAGIGVAPTGGGAVVCPVYYNGTIWVGG